MRSKPYANFFVKHSSEEKFSFEVYSHTKNFLKLDQIQIKFATSSNWNKTSEKVSYLRLMCHLQKPYADFYETWLINIHSVCRSRPFFLSVWTAGFIVQFEFSRRRHIVGDGIVYTLNDLVQWSFVSVHEVEHGIPSFCTTFCLMSHDYIVTRQKTNKQKKERSKRRQHFSTGGGWQVTGDGWRWKKSSNCYLKRDISHFLLYKLDYTE